MCDQVSFRVSAHFEPNEAQVHAHAHGPHANFWTFTKVKYMRQLSGSCKRSTQDYPKPFSDSFRGCSLKISVVMPNDFGNDLCTPFDLASQHFKCQVARSL